MNTSNPVVYFEIPVNDMKRAEQFYTNVFNFSFEKEDIDGYEMSLFPLKKKTVVLAALWRKVMRTNQQKMELLFILKQKILINL